MEGTQNALAPEGNVIFSFHTSVNLPIVTIMLAKLAQFTTRMTKIVTHNPRDVQHVLGMANYAAGLIEKPEADVRFAPLVDVLDINPHSGRWIMQTFPGVGASVSPMECMALAALMHRSHAKRVFEFGTYKGVSTTQLALNVGDDGMVFSLDLPEDHPAYSLPIPKASEREIAGETGKGILVPADLKGRVTFLRHDSATFDESIYCGTMDFVFVDGAHSYEYVRNDSVKGWNMLREGGIIAWHDFVPSHPDVVRFVRESGWNPRHVTDTTLAFAVK